MKIHKNFKIISVAILLIIIGVGLILYFNGGTGRFVDGCTRLDRINNNCVPAGECQPKDSKSNFAIDCAPKNYDSKFCHTGKPADCYPKL